MKWILVAAIAVVLVLAGAGVAWYVHIKHAGRDVKGSSTVEFVTTEAAPPPPPGPGIVWPTYGHDQERQRFARGISLAPPFRRAWMFRAQALVEFPPAVAYGRLFFANNNGVMYAIGARNGKRAWSYDSHRCVAASPAVDGDLVYETFLNAPPCNRKPSGSLTGELIAFNVGSGRVVWRKRIAPSESSPLVVAGSVLVGDWSGRVYAFAKRTGKLYWSTKLSGQVKGGVAVNGERAYIGDYSGHLYALGLRSGRVVWRAKSQPRFGHTGTFYATPTIAYGRVYIGATDGKMYSFGATSGKLRWSQSTGGYVYSSAAVWRDRVFDGSYSGEFYAFDAATGAIRWKFKANGPISGSPTVLAGRVYFATLKGTTYALDAQTGGPSWTFPDGKYSPVVADTKRLYLVGYTRVYGLDELRARIARTISEGTALRTLHRAGFRHLRVLARHPLTIRIGLDHHRARRNVCHIALYGADPNVARGWAALRKVCRA
jgi:outer membrane protein assembly factor BamB